MKFQLLEKDSQGNKIGSHRTGNRRYKAGDVLESDRHLDRIFRGKFKQVLDASIPVSKPEIIKLPKKMLAGQNAEAVMVGEQKGALPKEPPSPPPVQKQSRDTMFGVKETWSSPQAEEQIPTETSQQDPALQSGIASSPTAKSKHGIDVTDDFPDAGLTAMRIYHNMKTDSFLVVDEKSNEVLKRAKSEELIGKFLKAQLG